MRLGDASTHGRRLHASCTVAASHVATLFRHVVVLRDRWADALPARRGVRGCATRVNAGGTDGCATRAPKGTWGGGTKVLLCERSAGRHGGMLRTRMVTRHTPTLCSSCPFTLLTTRRPQLGVHQITGNLPLPTLSVLLATPHPYWVANLRYLPALPCQSYRHVGRVHIMQQLHRTAATTHVPPWLI